MSRLVVGDLNTPMIFKISRPKKIIVKISHPKEEYLQEIIRVKPLFKSSLIEKMKVSSKI
jgi:hypothetical protein